VAAHNRAVVDTANRRLVASLETSRDGEQGAPFAADTSPHTRSSLRPGPAKELDEFGL
jgi:hypothetical protein